MNICFVTLGCRANFSESQTWEEEINKLGGHIVSQDENVDIFVVNTCTVTDNADKKSKKQVLSLLKKSPNAKIVITGCGIESSKNKLPKEDENISHVNRDKLHDYFKKIIKTTDKITQLKSTLRTRAFLKVQDGCNNFCSYCIIPHARGRERSNAVSEVIKDVKNKLDQGYKEIVLTGIHLSNWNSENNFKNGDLADLVSEVLDKTEIKRLRFGSLEPRFFDQKFINILNDDRVCPHLHLSLQSGSQEILQSMKRHYTATEYKAMVDNLFKNVKDFSLTTDVIVGFPGESEELFQETINFIENINFAKLHVFPYSKRENTLAADMKDQIPENIKLQRSKILRKISLDKQRNFLKSLIGKTYPVLIEERKKGFYSGLTPNYARVWIDSKENLETNDIVDIKITSLNTDKSTLGLNGEEPTR